MEVLVLETENGKKHIRFNTKKELAILLAKEEYIALLKEKDFKGIPIDANEFFLEDNDEPINKDLYE